MKETVKMCKDCHRLHHWIFHLRNGKIYVEGAGCMLTDGGL